MTREATPPDPAQISRWAQAYLTKRLGAVAHVRRLLLAKAQRAGRLTGTDPGLIREWVDAEIARHVEKGNLNDAVYTEHKVRALRAKGTSQAHIQGVLRSKGVGTEHIREGLAVEDPEDDDVEDPDLTAARVHARKKRLGPYGPAKDALGRRKDFEKMMRAGFRAPHIRQVFEEEP